MKTLRIVGLFFFIAVIGILLVIAFAALCVRDFTTVVGCFALMFFLGLAFISMRAERGIAPVLDQAKIRADAAMSQQVPDYVTPIVGYRAWKWDFPPRLTSLNDQASWHPGQPMKAKCPRERHEPADAHCSCGIHATKTLDELSSMGYTGCTIFGEVYLWGRVVEHVHGWRAQFAYPKTLTVPLVWQNCPNIEALTAYGADIYLGDILLWTKQRGYTKRGKALRRLIQLKRSLFERDSKWFLPPFSPA